MSQSKLRNLIALTIATLFLITAPLATQAADKTAKDQPVRERLVLLPLQAGETGKAARAEMETALIQGLQQQYEVLSGKRVLHSLRKASAKTDHGARDKGCAETPCLKLAAKDLRAELFATAHVSKTDAGYLLSLGIRNVTTGQVMSDISVPCNGCDRSQLADKLKELGAAPTQVAATPAILRARDLPPGKVFKDCVDCPEMVVIPADSFDIGSSGSDQKDERPGRRITIEQPFAMGRFEITRGQFAAFVSATGYDAGNRCLMLAEGQWEESSGNNWRNPGYPQDDSHPVVCVNWSDAQAYVKWLSQQTGRHYQLPAETQWEYACRAGERDKYCGSDAADSVAWYAQDSGKTSHPVGTKQANVLGLFDMSGNVAEWMADTYHDHYDDIPSDGSAWIDDGAKRVLRGGSWIYSPTDVRADFRSVSDPAYRYFDTGFRVVRMIPPVVADEKKF
jgi:formylglycine-generating enzyme required for sulfatase activity